MISSSRQCVECAHNPVTSYDLKYRSSMTTSVVLHALKPVLSYFILSLTSHPVESSVSKPSDFYCHFSFFISLCSGRHKPFERLVFCYDITFERRPNEYSERISDQFAMYIASVYFCFFFLTILVPTIPGNSLSVKTIKV